MNQLTVMGSWPSRYRGANGATRTTSGIDTTIATSQALLTSILVGRSVA